MAIPVNIMFNEASMTDTLTILETNCGFVADPLDLGPDMVGGNFPNQDSLTLASRIEGIKIELNRGLSI